MSQTRIPSPAHSLGLTSPKRHRPRRSKSIGSPAPSNSSTRLTKVIQDVFELSPLLKRHSILTDDTDIEFEGRRSWWKRLDDSSRDALAVIESKDVAANNFIDEYDVEVLSQGKKKKILMDLPDSSDGESIASIVIPQKRLFHQKRNDKQKQFENVVKNRDTMNKTQLHNSSTNVDNMIEKIDNIAPRTLFGRREKQMKPVFPADLLNDSTNKTIADKTKELIAMEPKPIAPLFGNRVATKRKNMFVDFIISDSEDEVPEIQSKVFAFKRKSVEVPVASKCNNNSTSSSVGDIEMDDWKLLPSSTMMEHQLEIQTPKRSKPSNIDRSKEVIQDNFEKSMVQKQMEKRRSCNITNIHESDINGYGHSKEMPTNNECHNNDYITLKSSSTSTAENNHLTQITSVNEVDNSQHKTISNSKSSRETQSDNALSNNNTHENTTMKSPEAIRKAKTNSRTSVDFRSSLGPIRNKTSFFNETEHSNKSALSANKSGWDSHRTTRKTLRQTLGKDFSPRKSLRTLVIEKSAKMQTNLNRTSIAILPLANSTEYPQIDKSLDSYIDERNNKDIDHNPNTVKNLENEENMNEQLIKNAEVGSGRTHTSELKNKEAVTSQQANISQQEIQHTEKCKRQMKNVNQCNQIEESYQGIIRAGESVQELEQAVDYEQEIENRHSGEDVELKYESEQEAEKSEEEIKIIEESEKGKERSEKPEQIAAAEESEQEDEDANETEHEIEETDMLRFSQHEMEAEVGSEKEMAAEDESEHETEGLEESQQETEQEMEEAEQSQEETGHELQAEEESDQEIAAEEESDQEDEGSDETEHEIEETKESQHETEHEMESEEGSVKEMAAEEESEQETEEPEESQQETEQEMEEAKLSQEDTGHELEAAEESDQEIAAEVESEQETEGPEESQLETEQEIEEAEQSQEETDHELEAEEDSDQEIAAEEESERATEGSEESQQDIEEPEESEQEIEETEQNTKVAKQSDQEIEQFEQSEQEIEESEQETEQDNEVAEHSEQEVNVSYEDMDSDAADDQYNSRSMDNTDKENMEPDVEELQKKRSSIYDSVGSERGNNMSRRTKQTTLEIYLQKIKDDNKEKRRKMEEDIRQSLAAAKNRINNNYSKVPPRQLIKQTKPIQKNSKQKTPKMFALLDVLPEEVMADLKYKPPKRYQPKNAAWVTKRLYKYLETKLEPKYDYRARVRAEKLVEAIHSFTREARRLEVAPPASVDALKLEMARLGIVSTHHDFYVFFNNFMPREIRNKVCPDIVNKIPLPRPSVFADIIR